MVDFNDVGYPQSSYVTWCGYPAFGKTPIGMHPVSLINIKQKFRAIMQSNSQRIVIGLKHDELNFWQIFATRK